MHVGAGDKHVRKEDDPETSVGRGGARQGRGDGWGGVGKSDRRATGGREREEGNKIKRKYKKRKK